jgi:hypothetical protein
MGAGLAGSFRGTRVLHTDWSVSSFNWTAPQSETRQSKASEAKGHPGIPETSRPPDGRSAAADAGADGPSNEALQLTSGQCSRMMSEDVTAAQLGRAWTGSQLSLSCVSWPADSVTIPLVALALRARQAVQRSSSAGP